MPAASPRIFKNRVAVQYWLQLIAAAVMTMSFSRVAFSISPQISQRGSIHNSAKLGLDTPVPVHPGAPHLKTGWSMFALLHQVSCGAFIAAAAMRLKARNAHSKATTKQRIVCRALESAMTTFHWKTDSVEPRAFLETPEEILYSTSPGMSQGTTLHSHIRGATSDSSMSALCGLSWSLPTEERRAPKSSQARSSKHRSQRRAYHRTSASAAQEGRATRRHFGSRLHGSKEWSPAMSPSFDASLLRTKIQVGLRSNASFRVAGKRECKTPAGTRETEVASRGYTECKEFCSDNTKVFTNQDHDAPDIASTVITLARSASSLRLKCAR